MEVKHLDLNLSLFRETLEKNHGVKAGLLSSSSLTALWQICPSTFQQDHWHLSTLPLVSYFMEKNSGVTGFFLTTAIS